MKRIVILGAYQPDDLKTIIKTVKDNIDLTKFSIMSPIMFADGNEGQVALRMFAAADQGVVVTESDKIQLVFGPVAKKDKVDEVYILNTQTVILQEIFLAQYIDIFKEYYTHLDETKTFEDEMDLIEHLNGL